MRCAQGTSCSRAGELRGYAARALRLAVVVTLLAGLCLCTGCRESDALKQLIYDQTSTDVDTDNPTKYYISDENSDIESDSIPSVEVKKNATVTEEKQNIVVYGSDPNSSQYVSKHSIFSFDPDFNGIEASDGVYFVSEEEPETDEEENEDEEDDNTDYSEAQQAMEDQQEQDNGESDNTEQGDSGDADNNNGNGGNDGGDKDTIDTTNKHVDPPSVNKIAAYGDAAVIVQMIGGQGALAAADKHLLNSDFSKVFADEGAADIKTGWTGNGSLPRSIKAEEIIASGADTILIYSSEYKSKISSADRKALKKAGITFTLIPRLSNSTYIKQAVATVGKMLAESTDIGNAGSTEAMAQRYVDFYDELVDACISANGGTVAAESGTGDKDTGCYEKKNSKRSSYSYKTNAAYTLLIDSYDTSARFKKSWGVSSNVGSGSFSPVTNGVAIARIGYSDTPTSFYIQVGGVINNAAAKSSDTESGYLPVIQFNTNVYSFQKSYWTYKSGGGMSQAKSIGSTAWNRVLLHTSNNADGNGCGSSFGTDTFPTIIVDSQETKDLIIENSENSEGFYHPYSITPTNPAFFGVAITHASGMVQSLYSSIGVDGSLNTSTNVFSNGKIASSAVKINPTGLFSSWTEGSAESVLECAWVNDEVNGTSSTIDYQDVIKQFYSNFYRYDLSNSEISQIVKGE